MKKPVIDEGFYGAPNRWRRGCGPFVYQRQQEWRSGESAGVGIRRSSRGHAAFSTPTKSYPAIRAVCASMMLSNIYNVSFFLRCRQRSAFQKSLGLGLPFSHPLRRWWCRRICLGKCWSTISADAVKRYLWRWYQFAPSLFRAFSTATVLGRTWYWRYVCPLLFTYSFYRRWVYFCRWCWSGCWMSLPRFSDGAFDTFISVTSVCPWRVNTLRKQITIPRDESAKV